MKIRSKLNRCLIIIAAWSLVSPVILLSGCNKSKPKDPVHSGEYYFSTFEGDDLTTYLETLSDDIKEETLFFEAFYNKTGELRVFMNTQGSNTLISRKTDGSGYDSQNLDFTDRVVAICPEDTDTLWVMKSKLDNEYHISNSLFSYNLTTGKMNTTIACPDLKDKSIINVCRKSDGSFVVASKDSIDILSADGKNQKSFSPAKGALFESMTIAENGKIGAIYTVQNKETTPVLTLLSDKCSEEASFSLPGYSENNRIFGASGGFGNTFFVVSNAYAGILDTDTKSWSHWVEKESVKTADNADVGDSELVYEGGGIESVLAAYNNGNTISFYGLGDGIINSIEGFFSFSFHTYNPNRQTIRLGKLQTGIKYSYLNQLVNYYNRMQDQYFIEVKDYSSVSDQKMSEADSWRKSVTNLLSDLLTGNGPDLFIVQPSVEKALNKQDSLADLSPYLSTMDSTAFLPRIQELFDVGFGANESKDGIIHFISPFFTVNGMAYDNQIKNEYSSTRTFSEWIQTSKSRNRYVTGYNENANSLFPHAMCEILNESSDKTTTVQALTDLLGQVSLFCDHQKEMSKLDIDHPILQPVNIQSFQSYLDMMSSFEMGGFINHYPQTHSTFNIFFDECFCISSRSQFKDAAWDFISLLLLPQVQIQLNQNMIPILDDAFEKEITSHGSANIPGNDDMTERDIKGYPTYPLTNVAELADEYRNTINDLLTNSAQPYFTDEYILELCYEAIASVREGSKNPQDAATTLYDQASKYLQELS